LAKVHHSPITQSPFIYLYPAGHPARQFTPYLAYPDEQDVQNVGNRLHVAQEESQLTQV